MASISSSVKLRAALPNDIDLQVVADRTVTVVPWHKASTTVLGMLTSHSKERSLSQAHATILMAAQPVEEIA